MGGPVEADVAVEMPDAPVVVMSTARQVVLGASLALTYAVAAGTGTAVILVVPSLADDLGVSQLQAQWVASAYNLAFGCDLLFSGRLADMYGRKLLFELGLGISLVFTIISAVVPNLIALCVVRAIAGLGAAISSPASFGIVGVVFRTEPTRTIAFAILSMGNPIGATTGPVMGGAVAQSGPHGWKYIFYILAGVTAIPMILGFFTIPPDSAMRPPGQTKQDRKIDWAGGALITTGLSLFTFSLTQSGIAERGWRTPYIPTLLVLSILLMISFGFWERYVEVHTSIPPIAKISLFTRNGWKITIILCTSILMWVSAPAFVYLETIYYQTYKGVSPLKGAIYFLPATVCGIICCAFVIYAAPRFRVPVLLIPAGIVTGTCSLLYAVEPEGTSYWKCEFIAMICLPWAVDLPPANKSSNRLSGVGSVVISNLCSDDEQSVIGALFQTTVQVFWAVGVCVASLIVENQSSKSDDKADLLKGLRHAFWFTAVTAWTTSIVVFVFLRKLGLAKDVRRAGIIESEGIDHT